jgi:hypothetical protein
MIINAYMGSYICCPAGEPFVFHSHQRANSFLTECPEAITASQKEKLKLVTSEALTL